jgi:hypothetical protein
MPQCNSPTCWCNGGDGHRIASQIREVERDKVINDIRSHLDEIAEYVETPTNYDKHWCKPERDENDVIIYGTDCKNPKLCRSLQQIMGL